MSLPFPLICSTVTPDVLVSAFGVFVILPAGDCSMVHLETAFVLGLTEPGAGLVGATMSVWLIKVLSHVLEVPGMIAKFTDLGIPNPNSFGIALVGAVAVGAGIAIGVGGCRLVLIGRVGT